MRQPTTEKQRHWAAILNDAEQSGETLADYARANGLTAQALYQWRSVLKDPTPEPDTAETLPFSMVVTASTSTAMTVEVANTKLSFDRLPDVHWLSTLIRLQDNLS